MSLKDELSTITDQVKTEQDQRQREVERAAAVAKEVERQKAIASAIEFYKNELPGRLKQGALNGFHEHRIYYYQGNHADDVRIHHISALCRADGLTTDFSSYTSDYGDSSAPAVHTEHYLTISWK